MYISKRNVQTEGRPANHSGPKARTLLWFVLCSYRNICVVRTTMNLLLNRSQNVPLLECFPVSVVFIQQ